LPAADRTGVGAILAGAGLARGEGPRWTELAAEGALGLTPDEATGAAARAQADRTRKAAATRRARARAGSGAA
ncbi:MAG: hypothetical protein P4L30_10445, partial [Candidatus Limnocylindrales bacterium]|nr:hypothetical protein [Candidatus Limnocylindrales bacterium]